MKPFATVVVFLSLTLSASCWPDFYLYNSVANKLKIQASDLATALSNNGELFDEVYFLIHGFLGHAEKDWMMSMKDALLETSPTRSVIIVDWKDGANEFLNYNHASANVVENGFRVAELIRLGGLNPKKVTCVGHSLGAHSCGFAGKNAKLGRISGLDPAGPNFSGKSPSQRLDKTDADFVDVIHTDVCVFGITDAIGHIDFYPNGGRGQPGCFDTFSYVSKCLFSSPVVSKGILSSITGAVSSAVSSLTSLSSDLIKKITKCSHSKCQQYYTESIRAPLDIKLTSAKTDSYESYKSLSSANKCKNGCVLMGHSAVHSTLQGSFFNDYGQ